jgi:hypothetical protein
MNFGVARELRKIVTPENAESEIADLLYGRLVSDPIADKALANIGSRIHDPCLPYPVLSQAQAGG